MRRSSNSLLESLLDGYSHVDELHQVMAIILLAKYLMRVSLGRLSRTLFEPRAVCLCQPVGKKFADHIRLTSRAYP